MEITLAVLLQHYLDDARREGRRAIPAARSCVRALLATPLAPRVATTVTYRELRALAQQWMADGLRPATINRRFGILRRAVRVGVRDGLLPAGTALDVPHFLEQNVRQGFVEADVMQRVLEALAGTPDVRDFVEWLWLTAMRRGEAAQLTWDMLADAELRISGAITKNGRSRVLPIPPHSPVAALLARRRACQQGPYIFHERGRPLRYIHRVWKRAVQAAGVPHVVPHDLRRSAIRRFRQQGASIEVCMALAGHTTPSMFYRYRIVGADEMANALQR